MDVISDYFNYIINQLLSMKINDILDILIVTVLLYYTIKFMRERRAAKLVFGIVLLLALLWASDIFELNSLNFLLTNIVQVGMMALIIVFQPELRSALEKVGGNSLRGFNRKLTAAQSSEMQELIGLIAESISTLSRSKTGALLVIERNTKLGDVIKSGVVVDSVFSLRLIGNLFFNKAPLHDGAVVMRGNRIYAAGCVLPLSENRDAVNNLGTRHRAGLGMSENSDAVVIIVSEETGIISVAVDGKFKRGFTKNSLIDFLTSMLIEDRTNVTDIVKRGFSFGRKKDK